MRIYILKPKEEVLFKDVELGETFYIKNHEPEEFYLKVVDIDASPQKARAVSLTTNRVMSFSQDCLCVLYPLELRNAE